MALWPLAQWRSVRCDRGVGDRSPRIRSVGVGKSKIASLKIGVLEVDTLRVRKLEVTEKTP